MNLLIGYHKFLVEALVFVIVANIVLQLLLKNSQFKYIQYTRVGYFAFWAVWAMAIFSGLIVFVFAKAIVTPKVLVMIVASILLPFLDGYRAIKLGKIWQQKGLGLGFSIGVMVIEIAIIASVIVYSVVSR